MLVLDFFKKTARKGYTLLEIMIGVSILAIGVIGVLTVFQEDRFKPNYHVETKKNMDEIEEALKNFYELNGYLPCPSDPLQTDTSLFGRASTYNSTTHTCRDISNNYLTHGILPFKDLKIDEKLTYDGWGRRITYRVADSVSKATDFDIALRDLKVIDISGVELTKTIHNSTFYNDENFGAVYVLISHGPDGRGAFQEPILSGGTQIQPRQQSAFDLNKIDGLNADTTRAYEYVYSPEFEKLGDILIFRTRADFGSNIRATSSIKFPVDVCKFAQRYDDYYSQDTTTTYVSSGGPNPASFATMNKNQPQLWQAIGSEFQLHLRTIAHKVGKLCENPPKYDVCSFKPTMIHDDDLTFWLDFDDHDGDGNRSNNIIGTTLTTGNFVPKKGSITSAIGDPKITDYTPFANFVDSSGNTVSRQSFRTSLYDTSLTTLFFNSSDIWDGIGSNNTMQNLTIFVVAALDTTGFSNAQYSRLWPFSTPTYTGTDLKGMNIGWGRLADNAGNAPYVAHRNGHLMSITAPFSNSGYEPVIFMYRLDREGEIAAGENHLTYLNLRPAQGAKFAVMQKDGGYFEYAGNTEARYHTTADLYYIGANPELELSHGSSFRGWVGEVIAYKRGLKAHEYQPIMSYLYNKWMAGACE